MISWNGVSCFTEGFVFQMGGASFLSVGGGGCPWGASVLVGGGFEKNCKMGAAPHAPTMGKPEKNHLIIIVLY